MAAAGQLTQLLQAAQSADAGVRTQAEQQLAALQAQNFSELLVSLSAELADGGKPVDARRLAGLILKNSLDAKEAARKASGRPPACWGPRWPPPAARSRRRVQGRGRAAACRCLPFDRRHDVPSLLQAQLVQQWVVLDEGVKKQVKHNLLATLGTQVGAGSRGAAPPNAAPAPQPPATAAGALRGRRMHGCCRACTCARAATAVSHGSCVPRSAVVRRLAAADAR